MRFTRPNRSRLPTTGGAERFRSVLGRARHVLNSAAGRSATRAPSRRNEFAAVVLSFPKYSQQWVTRMVERVDFSDVERYPHEVSVHVDLSRMREAFGSDDAGRLNHQSGGELIIPIGRLRRGLHRRIDVTDGAGAEVARLTSSEERELVAQLAVHLLGLVVEFMHADRGGARISIFRRNRGRRTIADTSVSAAQRMRALRTTPRSLRVTASELERLVQSSIRDPPEQARLAAEQLRSDLALLVARAPSAAEVADLLSTITQTFSEHFLLLVVIDEAGPQRRSFQFSYSEPAVGLGRHSSNQRASPAVKAIWGNQSPGRQRAAAIRRALLFWAAAPSRERLLYFPLFDFADRYHVELTAPAGVYLVDSELGWTCKRDGDVVFGGSRGDDNRLLGSAHLRAPRDGCDDWDEVVVRTHLYPPVTGVLTSTAVFGVLAVALLVASGMSMFDAAPWYWWHSAASWTLKARPHDRSSATAAMLILPTIAQVLMFRYDEHSTVSVLIRRTRSVFVLTTLPLALLAVLIAFPADVAHPARWWLAALYTTAAGSVLLIWHLARVTAILGRERRRRITRSLSVAGVQNS